jgi:hypothetical protein
MRPFRENGFCFKKRQYGFLPVAAIRWVRRRTFEHEAHTDVAAALEPVHFLSQPFEYGSVHMFVAISSCLRTLFFGINLVARLRYQPLGPRSTK